MESKLRVALLGYGWVAKQIHLPVLMGLEGIDVVAIAEADAARCEEVSHSLPDAAVFDRIETLLGDAQLDAALITLPNALHASASVAAFKRGLHVYLEKPMAPTLAAAGGRRADRFLDTIAGSARLEAATGDRRRSVAGRASPSGCRIEPERRLGK